MKNNLVYKCLLSTLTLGLCASAADVSADGTAVSNLADKKALFMGDSITYGIGDQDKGWSTRIESVTGMKCVNVGVQGARASHTREEEKILVNQLDSVADNDFDIVVLHIGVNDVRNNIPVGNITAEGDSGYDLKTFAGGFEDTVAKVRERFPNADLFYIENYRIDGDKAKMGYTAEMADYFAVAEQICAKWNISVIDLFNNSELNAALECTTTKYLYDMLHPNADGYDIITPYILEKLEAYYHVPETEAVVETDSALGSPTAVDGSKKTSAVPFIIGGAAVLLALIAAILVHRFK